MFRSVLRRFVCSPAVASCCGGECCGRFICESGDCNLASCGSLAPLDPLPSSIDDSVARYLAFVVLRCVGGLQFNQSDDSAASCAIANSSLSHLSGKLCHSDYIVLWYLPSPQSIK